MSSRHTKKPCARTQQPPLIARTRPRPCPVLSHVRGRRRTEQSISIAQRRQLGGAPSQRGGPICWEMGEIFRKNDAKSFEYCKELANLVIPKTDFFRDFKLETLKHVSAMNFKSTDISNCSWSYLLDPNKTTKNSLVGLKRAVSCFRLIESL